MIALKFLLYWVAGTALIHIISLIAPKDVALGNQYIASFQASGLTGFILATVNIISESALTTFGKNLNKKYLPLTVRFMTNAVGVWVITRMALLLGLGVTSIFWVIILAAAITLSQISISKVIEN